LIEGRREKMLRLWNRKGVAVRKWRSRAWSIDPKVTNLTIIKTEADKLESIDKGGPDWNFNLIFPRLFQSYPQYFEAITDIEQVDC
jgi:argininosuccinate synthase